MTYSWKVKKKDPNSLSAVIKVVTFTVVVKKTKQADEVARFSFADL